MATDKHALKTPHSRAKNAKKNHPYAAVQHRVIDSPAYADLSASSQALLTLIARQLKPENNNGKLTITHEGRGDSGFKKYGFAESTLRRCILELQEHGFLFRTRGSSYDDKTKRGQAALYAVTWLSLCKDTTNLFLHGYTASAWQDWEKGKVIFNQPQRKKHTSKMAVKRTEIELRPHEVPPNSAYYHPPKTGNKTILIPSSVVRDLQSVKHDSISPLAIANFINVSSAYLGGYRHAA